MKHREVIFREEAVEDLDAAVAFYRSIDEALGDHCFSSLIADIESLEFLRVSIRSISGLSAYGRNGFLSIFTTMRMRPQ